MKAWFDIEGLRILTVAKITEQCKIKLCLKYASAKYVHHMDK